MFQTTCHLLAFANLRKLTLPDSLKRKNAWEVFVANVVRETMDLNCQGQTTKLHPARWLRRKMPYSVSKGL